MFKRQLIFFGPDGASENKGGAIVHGEAAADKIAEWKVKYPLGVKLITVTDPRTNEKHKGYFRRPDFDELNMGYAKMDRENMLDMWREFATVTWLGGSEAILDNATLFCGTMKMLQKLVDGAEAEISDL